MPGTKTKPTVSRRLLNQEQRKKAVEEAAYFRWLARNQEHGKDLDDWLDAEQELMENIFEHDIES